MAYYVVERKSGFGDVIAATTIATHLKRMGHQVHFLLSLIHISEPTRPY